MSPRTSHGHDVESTSLEILESQLFKVPFTHVPKQHNSNSITRTHIANKALCRLLYQPLQRQSPIRLLSTTAAKPQQSRNLLEDADNGFGFVRHNPIPPKPRTKVVTEIRAPITAPWGLDI